MSNSPELDSGLLFDVSPEERDGQEKKKPSKKQRPDERPRPAGPLDFPSEARWLGSVEGHYQCDQCGIGILDIAETRKVDGAAKWLVCCGWVCGHCWLVDPVPGVLDKREEGREFRVRGGRFDGMTFSEIAAEGGRWYIEQLVKAGKRQVLAEEAAKWLALTGS